jgi:hypothetical protein
MNNQHYHDVLIIIGHSHQFDDPTVKQRCHLAAEVFHQGSAAQILLTGGYDHSLDIKPIRSQAEALRYCLIDKEVPAACLFMEEKSSQLIENLYFCKTEFLLPCSWFDIGIVTSDDAVLTTRWVASKVLGEQVTVTIYPAIQDHHQPIASDQASLAEMQGTYGGIKGGDHNAVKKLIASSTKTRIPE